MFFVTFTALFPILVFTSTSSYTILVHLFTSFNYYLLLTRAQSAYLCLPRHSLLVQYIRTLWTLSFCS